MNAENEYAHFQWVGKRDAGYDDLTARQRAGSTALFQQLTVDIPIIEFGKLPPAKLKEVIQSSEWYWATTALGDGRKLPQDDANASAVIRNTLATADPRVLLEEHPI